MSIYVNVVNQKMSISSTFDGIVTGTQRFVEFKFNLSDDWNGLMPFAQFAQNGVAYNQYLDANNSVTLPSEIGEGTCTLMLFGSAGTKRATTNFLTLKVDKDILIQDAQSTRLSQSLYDQLVAKVDAVTSFNSQGVIDLQNSISDLETRINARATLQQLTAENVRARAAENANTQAIALKADQSALDDLSDRVEHLQNNQFVADAIESAVAETIADYLLAGELANLTIEDGCITRSKLGTDVESVLQTAESAMQPSVYDTSNRQADVYEYAQSRADIVMDAHNALLNEVMEARSPADGTRMPTLKESIRKSIDISKAYTRAMLSEYEPFTIKVVDNLPATGTERTFYLIPKESGNGFDKYWYVENSVGDKVWDCFGASSTLVVDTLPASGDVDTDYILKTTNGCLYYKWIDNEWKVVAGSLAYVASTLPSVAKGNEFTDYYIVNSDNGSYIHYRFINGAYKVIGGNSYTKAEVDAKLSTLRSDMTTADTAIRGTVESNSQAIATNSTNINALSRSVTLLRDDVDAIDTEGYTYEAQYEADTNTFTLYETKEGETNVKNQFVITGGGGGTGTTTTTTMTVDRITPSPLIITPSDSAIIEIDFSSVDNDNQTVDATYTWKSGSTVLMTGSLNQGRNTFDLSKFVTVGTQKFSLTTVDEAGTMMLKTWTIQKVDVRIESNFSDRFTTATGRSVSFTYTPYGAATKTVHFKIDGVEDTVTTTASGTLQSYTIPAKSHGSHLLEVWITATINNVEVETAHIFKDIIWYNASSSTPVIGCVYRFDHRGTVNMRQYDTIAIEYNVFDPQTNYPTVQRYVDGTLVGTDTVSTSYNVWNFKSDDVGLHTLQIKVRTKTVTIKINVTELGIDVSPVTGGLEIDFNPVGITNSSNNRLWKSGSYKMTVSSNFDWANGGYKTDENGDAYFLIKAGTTASFNYLMFGGGIDGNPSVNGAEMKLIFMTENVRDANAVWFTNVETTTTGSGSNAQTTKLGIQLGVHEGWLKTNSASDTAVEGEGEGTSIAATNTYLYMPYSEEDIIEMDINIDSIDRTNQSAQAFVMAYEDGVPSKAFVYNNSDRFYQYTPQPIVIGSPDCDVRIYRLKIYSASLSTENIMKNFIADSRDSTTMLSRYDRNSIYYNRDLNEYTPYSSSGVLDPEKLAPMIPNVKVIMIETDHFTTSKKTFVKSKVRCIHATGGDKYEGDPYYDNWLFENGYHAGQGTTSDNYGNSGRNIDILFNSDGVHKPSDKVNAEAGYVSKVTLGYGSESSRTESVTDWKGDAGKVALTRTSVPNNFFNIKVNIASSENVNNALLQKRYNDFLPYVSPAKKRDSKIKNDMEFVPCVVFLRETNEDISAHNEFLDTNWHFYALGNIGDSKKTDYTRAYDPEDMNEFTIEISDNTKNNATFQSGVYMDGNTRKIEAFTRVNGEAVSTAKPQSFVYPITEAEWNNANNMRRWCLENEAFDGDHSFEPRYACCGDYRDGKLVNDTSGRGNAQLLLNARVWRAFYKWVVTSTDAQFKNELDQWCVRSAVEFWYAFTHIYTMMDNRAKNTFWHFAKTGTYRAVSRPVADLLHIYCEKSGSNYVPTTDTSIQSGKTYYTQYAFDLWDYDNDTALGINNNGELAFPYGKEDSDYNIDGDPSSGYVFNGATSTFWCRLRDLCANEIRNTFTSVVDECFSANNLIKQFDDFQECYPEEIWRLDIERKYIRTFTGASVDNSKPKKDVQYLRDMMQGRKKYQRRQWVRDQEMYFGTMNLMNTVVGDHNRITFRCFTPTGNNIVVAPNYTLRITPYSDMYLSVMFGNGDVKQVRAKGGTEYTITCPLSTMDDTQITIYGANRIQAMNDLSACYIAANNFSMATKLRKLVVGNPTSGYSNPRLISLTLGNNTLLEELDIRNCGNLTGSLNLDPCNNLQKLYAEGTQITGVIFSTNGKLKIAHLPNTVNTLTMRGLNSITDFQASLSNIETLTLEGGVLNDQTIINSCIDTLRVLYLYNINWIGNKSLADTTLLNTMLGLFSSVVTGKVNISGAIRQNELDNYAEKWDDLEVLYDPNNMVPQHRVRYVNANSQSTVLYTAYVDQGATPPDPYALGLIPKPTLAADTQYTYEFDSWNEITSPVLAERTVKAVYRKTTRTYTVTWYSRPGLSLGSVTAQYGADVVYSGDTPTDTSGEGNYTFKVFKGWDKSTGFIRGDTDVFAQWDEASLPSAGTDLKDMSPAEISAVVKTGRTDSYFTMKDHTDIVLGHDFNFSNVTSEVLAENVYLDGSTAIDISTTLFAQNSGSFTMAIDYQFSNTTVNGTLVSCYDNNGQEGFRLKYNTSPEIQWGDTRQQIGSGKFRDIVVIRHRKGENKLYVYASNGTTSSSNFDTAIIRAELTRSRNTSTNQIITLGAVRFPADGGHDDYGRGHIHWCKIWHDDLGDTNARKLASWCHEPLRMEYRGSGNYRLAGGSSQKAGASFICNHLLGGRGQQMNTSNINNGGWNASKMRTFLNERFIEAIPTVWRSMLKRVKVDASAGNQSTEILSSEDYIYLPCIKELNNSGDVVYSNEGSYITWYTNNYRRIKFRGRITDTAAAQNPFVAASDPSTNTANVVKPGSIWINTGNDSRGYIYVTSEELDRYNITADYTASIGGGWVSANWWWLRSPNVSGSANFWIVSGSGYCNNNGASGTGGVCPCFSI